MKLDQFRRECCRRAIEWWGIDPQFNMMIEECAELIQAIQKYKRNDGFIDQELINKMCEEVADVKIMVAQIEYLYPKQVRKWEAVKLTRLKERLDDAQQKTNHS